MEYGKLNHDDLAIIRNDQGEALAKYHDWDRGDFGYTGDYYRTDYFAFFGTDLTVRATEVEFVTKVKVVEDTDTDG